MRNRLVKVFITAIATATLATSFTVNTEASTLNKKTITITEGKSTTLKVKGISSKIKVTWKTSKKPVATVSSKGKITAKKKGTAIISAKFTVKSNKKKVTKTLKCKVNVKAKAVKKATPTPKPTKTPKPTVTPRPTSTPKPTATPMVEPTSTPEPTATPIPESVQAVSPETPIHVHDYNARYEVVKESTCTEDGLINMYCECGEVYQRVISARHHRVKYSINTCLLPTETSEGYSGCHCMDCGEDVTYSKLTTFPALTDENYPLDGWVYEIHTYRYPELVDEYSKVDSRHKNPYIVVKDYIGTAEHPALKGSYVIDGVKYDVVTQGEVRCSSPTVQSIRFFGCSIENPDCTMLLEKDIMWYFMGGRTILD